MGGVVFDMDMNLMVQYLTFVSVRSNFGWKLVFSNFTIVAFVNYMQNPTMKRFLRMP